MKQKQLAKAIKHQIGPGHADMKHNQKGWNTPSSTMKADEMESDDDSVLGEQDHSKLTQQ